MPIVSPRLALGGPRVALWMLLMATLGCVPSAHNGVVRISDGAITLVRTDGPTVRLVAANPAVPLEKLEGYVVKVDGERRFGRLRVQEYAILDAGDGSTPFVGVLTRVGLQWELRDQNSGSTYRLVGTSVAPALAGHQGEVIVISGYVAGHHEINVVRWRALGPPPGP